MIDVNAAVQIAEEALNRHFALEDDTVVVFDYTEDDECYWFQYNSHRYLQTGDLLCAIIEGHPIGIRKSDGTIA